MKVNDDQTSFYTKWRKDKYFADLMILFSDIHHKVCHNYALMFDTNIEMADILQKAYVICTQVTLMANVKQDD